jgi:hypothetical protein
MCGLALALVSLAACASETARAPACRPGMGRPMLVVELFFGRAVAGRGDVTDGEWARFVDGVVAPALPDGFTVLDGDGAWLNPATRVSARERSKVLVVALPDTAERLAAIGQVRAAYQQAFHQQLVGMIVAPACGSF